LCSSVPKSVRTSMFPVSGALLHRLGREVRRAAHDLGKRRVLGVREAGGGWVPYLI
jgi:hypothetical protein